MIVPFKEYPWPIIEGRTPKPHQIETVKFHLLNKRSYNLSTMGTAKTMSALWACDFLMMNKKIDCVLVVAPLSTIETVWYDEVRNNLPHRKVVIVHHPNKAVRRQLLQKEAHFYITNHDGVKVLNQELINKKFKVVIIDELTCCKNFSIERTKAMKRITDKADAVWGLTGEPTPNSPTEAFGQAKVVTPHTAPRYFARFRDATMTQFDQYTYIPKLGWQDVVYKTLSPYIRFTLEQVAPDMPPLTFETRKFEMTKEQKKYYDQMHKEFVIEYNKGLITAVNSGVKALKLLQIGCGSVRDTEQDTAIIIDNKPKLQELITILEESKKLIVFVPFRDSLAAIAEYLRSKKISVGVVHGDVPRKERVQIFSNFQKRDLQVLVMHPKTSAHGLTLTKSHVIVWFGPYPDNEIYGQANARIRRFGQEHPQVIIKFQNSDAEKRVYAILNRKGKMSKSLLELFK